MFVRDLRIVRTLAGFAVAAALGLTAGVAAQQPPAAPAPAPRAPAPQAPAPQAPPPAAPTAPAAQAAGPLLGFTADAGLVLFTLKDDCPPAAPAAAAAAPGQPAPAPGAAAPAAPAAGQAPAEKCQPGSKDFEAFFAKVKEALQRGSKPEYKQMAAGWKLYKVLDGAAPGDVLYASIMDPTVKGVDYDPVKILGDVMPDDARALFPRLQAAIKSVNRLNLQTIMKMGGN